MNYPLGFLLPKSVRLTGSIDVGFCSSFRHFFLPPPPFKFCNELMDVVCSLKTKRSFVQLMIKQVYIHHASRST